MDLALVLPGLLFVTWPLQFRWSIRRIRAKIAATGGDTSEFDRRMNRRWIRIAQVAAPICGVIAIVLGVTS